MAVFKAPRITSLQRGGLLLDASEIVYDTDENSFYGGNGLDVGGFPIGRGSGSSVFIYELKAIDITRKFITIPISPFSPSTVRMNIIGGIEQLNGVDFVVTGNIVSWDGLGLDDFLEVGDILLIQF
jgi:hypothetical protein